MALEETIGLIRAMAIAFSIGLSVGYLVGGVLCILFGGYPQKNATLRYRIFVNTVAGSIVFAFMFLVLDLPLPKPDHLGAVILLMVPGMAWAVIDYFQIVPSPNP